MNKWIIGFTAFGLSALLLVFSIIISPLVFFGALAAFILILIYAGIVQLIENRLIKQKFKKDKWLEEMEKELGL